MSLIAISGKKNSGKDLVGEIIQYLIHTKGKIDMEYFHTFQNNSTFNRENFSGYKNKKFADKLKDVVCLLIGCTREQLENEVFKNTELGSEWNCTILRGTTTGRKRLILETTHVGISRQLGSSWVSDGVQRMTPRLMLQLIGTECGRDILHPNIWVNSLMSEYSHSCYCEDSAARQGTCDRTKCTYDNWVITDMRFPNEAEAVKQRKGLLIRVESKRCNYDDNHPSETALDDYGGVGNEVRTDRWDKVIFNDGSIEDLIEEVKKFLIKEEII